MNRNHTSGMESAPRPRRWNRSPANSLSLSVSSSLCALVPIYLASWCLYGLVFRIRRMVAPDEYGS